MAEVTILKFTTEMAMEGGKEYGCGGPGEGGDVVWCNRAQPLILYGTMSLRHFLNTNK